MATLEATPAAPRRPVPRAPARWLAGSRGQAIALAFLAATLVWPALLGRGVLAALDTARVALPWSALPGGAVHNQTLSDSLAQFYAWRVFWAASLRAGAAPLWDPYILGGHPTFASINEGTFDPLNLIAVALPVSYALGLIAWIHLTIAGIGARAFARLHVQDDAGACLAAVLAMLGLPVVVWLEFPPFASTLCWLGAILFFLERTVRHRRPRDAALAGLGIGLSLLGGQTQYSLDLAGVVLVYVAARLVASRDGWPAQSRRLALLGVAALVGGGIGAIAYAPALEMLPRIDRGPLADEQFAALTLPLRNVGTFLLPNLFGVPTRGNFGGFFNYNETAVYVGLIPLLLLPFGIGARPVRSAVVAFAGLTGAAMLLLFGWGPAVHLVWRLPPLSYFGLSRLGAILPWCVGFLAAAGYARLPAEGRARRSRGLVAAGGAALPAAALAAAAAYQRQLPGQAAWWRHDAALAGLTLVVSLAVVLVRIRSPRHSPAAWLGPIVLAADLLAIGGGYNTIAGSDPYAGPPPPPLDRLPAGVLAPRSVGLSLDQLVFPPNLGLFWSIPTADGYTSEHLASYGEFVRHATPVNLEEAATGVHPGGSYVNFGQARPPYLDLLGVRYLITPRDPELPDQLYPARDGASPVLAGARTVGTIFRARQDGLNRIDVYPVTHGRPVPHWLALHLKDSPTSPDHLAYVRLDGNQARDGQPLSFWFKPIPHSAGHTYYVYFDAPEARDADGLALGVRSGAGGGPPLWEDGRQQPGALALDVYANPSVNWTKIAEANRLAVYENPGALPRAFVVPRAVKLGDDAFYAALDAESLDPATAAAVSTGPPAGFGNVAGAGRGFHPTVAVREARPDAIELDVALDRPGLLVVTNAWYPGWTATVDGAAGPVERVDAVFQGVYLAGGRHRVRLAFGPASLRLGALLGALGLALAIAAFVADSRIEGSPPGATGETRILSPVAPGGEL